MSTFFPGRASEPFAQGGNNVDMIDHSTHPPKASPIPAYAILQQEAAQAYGRQPKGFK